MEVEGFNHSVMLVMNEPLLSTEVLEMKQSRRKHTDKWFQNEA